MVKSRRLRIKKRSNKTRSTRRTRDSRRRHHRKTRTLKGGLTCYDSKGWPDRKGLYDAKGNRDYDCPIKDSTAEKSSVSSWERGYGAMRGY